MQDNGPLQETIATYMNAKSLGKKRAARYRMDFLAFNRLQAAMVAGFMKKPGKVLVSLTMSGREVLTHNDIPGAQ